MSAQVSASDGENPPPLEGRDTVRVGTDDDGVAGAVTGHLVHGLKAAVLGERAR